MIFWIVIIFYDGIFLELDFSRDLILKDFDRRQWKIKFFLFFLHLHARETRFAILFRLRNPRI